MIDRDCVEFLKWSLPLLRMRWQGFRRVRGRVCKRIDRRLSELGLPDAAAYRTFLEANGAEWTMLDSLCTVTISRFYRDRETFQFLEHEVFPSLCRAAEAHSGQALRSWSIGCASGEEPYTLALLWDLVMARRFPELSLTVLATDVDPVAIERAKAGCYKSGSCAGLPADWRNQAFVRKGEFTCMRDELMNRVSFLAQDIRKTAPLERFHLILCRNLAFTYFDTGLQREVLSRISDCLLSGGALVTGIHESLPAGYGELTPWPGGRGIYRKEAKRLAHSGDVRLAAESGLSGAPSAKSQARD